MLEKVVQYPAAGVREADIYFQLKLMPQIKT